MQDTMEYLGGSLIQHGKYSDRVYLMNLSKGDMPGLPERLNDFAEEHGYAKVFAKVPAAHAGGLWHRSAGAGVLLQSRGRPVYGPLPESAEA
jgi:hypothetical protein